MVSENPTESNINGAIDNIDDHNLMQYALLQDQWWLVLWWQCWARLGGQAGSLMTTRQVDKRRRLNLVSINFYNIQISFINLLVGIFSTIIIELYHHCRYPHWSASSTHSNDMTNRTTTSQGPSQPDFFASRRFIQHPAASFSKLAHWLDAGWTHFCIIQNFLFHSLSSIQHPASNDNCRKLVTIIRQRQ